MVGEILGSYRIVTKLGEGGMGAVYIAEHALLGRRAAVKVLLPSLSVSPEIVRRFFNEARAATRIKHPGIVEIYDFGEEPRGPSYIVMELLAGESLARRLGRRGRISVEEMLRLAKQLTGALGAAHAAGIVHRDLKPENIHLVPDPDVVGGERTKILDFGIAKLAGATHPETLKTKTGSVIGTPTYMAPEQCRGLGDVDHRADIYSLACVLFEMLSGHPPFVSPASGELIAAHLYAAPPRLITINPGVPASVEAAILRALAKDPGARQPSMEALAVELGAGATRAPAAAGEGTADAVNLSSHLSTLRFAAAETRPDPRRRSRRRKVIALAAGLAAIGTTSVILVTAGSENRRTEREQAAPMTSRVPEREDGTTAGVAGAGPMLRPSSPPTAAEPEVARGERAPRDARASFEGTVISASAHDEMTPTKPRSTMKKRPQDHPPPTEPVEDTATAPGKMEDKSMPKPIDPDKDL